MSLPLSALVVGGDRLVDPGFIRGQGIEYRRQHDRGQ